MLEWLKLRLRSLFRKNEIEKELDEELRFYLDNQTEQYLAQGMSPGEARLAALKEFGGVEQAKEECRDARGLSFIEELWQDLHSALDSDSRTEMYFPFSQFPSWNMTLVVRTSGDPMSLVAAARRQVLAVNPNQAVFNVRTMEQLMDNSVSQRRFNMLLLSIFATISLVLAAVGIYSVLAYSVAQRTQEIGVRMALGAHSADVLKLIIAQGMVLVLIGAALGLAAAFALTRVMTSLLYGVSPTDPLTFAMIALLLLGVALVACFVPALRATKVDPIIALRYE